MNNVAINLKLDNTYTFPSRRMDDNYVATGITHNGILYTELSEFSKRNKGFSVPTLRRLIKKVEHQHCDNFFIRWENKLYVSPAIKLLRNISYSQVDLLTGSWLGYLAAFEWDFFGAVHFKRELQLLTVVEKAKKYFEIITKKYSGAEFRLFIACEKNLNDSGYHLHFLLWSDHQGKTDIKSFTEGHFRGKGGKPYANTRMEPFDPEEGGIAYLLKEIHNKDCADFLWKNRIPESRSVTSNSKPQISSLETH